MAPLQGLGVTTWTGSPDLESQGRGEPDCVKLSFATLFPKRIIWDNPSIQPRCAN